MSREFSLEGVNDKDVQKGESNKPLHIILLGLPKITWEQEALAVPRRIEVALPAVLGVQAAERP
jgi:hypothetical protein